MSKKKAAGRNPFEIIEERFQNGKPLKDLTRRAGMSRECWYNLKKKWPEVYVRLDWLEELFKEFGLEPNEFFEMGK